MRKGFFIFVVLLMLFSCASKDQNLSESQLFFVETYTFITKVEAVRVEILTAAGEAYRRGDLTSEKLEVIRGAGIMLEKSLKLARNAANMYFEGLESRKAVEKALQAVQEHRKLFLRVGGDGK